MLLASRRAALRRPAPTSDAKRVRANSSAPAQHPSFTLLRSEAITEHAAVASLYRHNGTGAELLSVVCKETEKVFGVALKTVPTDDTGVAHILEHSSLCGSRMFPTKEPFVELMKSSLQTYLNAMTYPDRTVYPVASPNTADFHNLTRVYLDAVFAPQLAKWVLSQEGHHVSPQGLDMAGPGEEGGHEGAAAPPSAAAATADVKAQSRTPSLLYKGVVFNEMKGVYSSGDSVHAQSCESAVFPDTAYAHSSGGDPRAIPRLTFDAFTQFHADNYTPGRAKLFFFGDDPEADRLAIVAHALESAVPGGLERAAEQPATPSPTQLTLRVQAPFLKPQTLHVAYPAAGAGAGAGASAPVSEDPGFVVDPFLGPSGGLVAVATPALAGAAPSQSGALPPVATRAVPGVPDEHFVTVNWCLTGGVLRAGQSSSMTESDAAHLFTAADRLGLALLSHLLMGTQASTLRKALTDAALGSAVTGGGLDDGLLQPVFSAGLKGVKAADVERVDAVVLGTLARAGDAGFDDTHIAASLNTLEFQLREFASGGGPRGLALFLGAAPGWMYGRDPIGELRYEAALQEVKASIRAQGSAYFQALLRKYLIDNAHRVTVHSYPDPAWTARREAEEDAELSTKAEALAARPGGLDAVAQAAAALLERQATPDSPAALASIPSLTLDDLGAQQSSIAVQVRSTTTGRPAPLLVHEEPTAGIGYMAVHFNLSALPARLLPLLPLFSWCMTSTGTRGMDEVTMSRALGAHTGGVRAGVSVLDVPGRPEGGVPRLSFSGKALSSQGGKLGEMMALLATESRLDARDRVTHALRDTVSRHKAGIVGGGHRYAGGLISACLSLPGWYSEQWGGLVGLHVARSLLSAVVGGSGAGEGFEPTLRDKVTRSAWQTAHAEVSALTASPAPADAAFLPPSSFDELVHCLMEIRAHVITQAALHSAVVTGDGASLTAMDTALHTLLSALPEGDARQSVPLHPHRPDSTLLLYPALRAYSTDAGTARDALHALQPQTGVVGGGRVGVGIVAPSAQVNFVVKAGSVGGVYGGATGRSLSGGAEVASAVLRNGYLWDKVRVQGGAYGGFATLNRQTGNMSFASYRDPHVKRTLAAFDGSAAHLKALASATDGTPTEELRKAIISTIGGIDAPMAPAERGDVSATRWAMGIDHAALQRRRDEVRGASVQDLRDFGRAAAHVAEHGRVAVVGSERALAAAHEDEVGGTSFTLLRPLQ